MKALLLAALLTADGGTVRGAPDGGTDRPVIPLVRGALLLEDGGVVDVRGGVWFSDPEVLAMGQDHAALRVGGEHLEAHVADVPYQWVALAAAVGLTVGLIAGGIAGAVAAKEIR